MNILVLFEQTLTAVKSGDIKGAACAAGKLVSAVSCDSPAAMLANASDTGDEPKMSGAELRAKCEEKCAELVGACDHNEHLVRTGIASDTALPPGTFLKLAQFVIQIVSLFVKFPVGGDTPAPAPAPALPGA